jgi:hypothetical protein
VRAIQAFQLGFQVQLGPFHSIKRVTATRVGAITARNFQKFCGFVLQSGEIALKILFPALMSNSKPFDVDVISKWIRTSPIFVLDFSLARRNYHKCGISDRHGISIGRGWGEADY